MELGERKKLILQAIVEDYIASAEPVGSRNIAKNHDLGLSAATIRNEMADLEEMGFLDKPHTSAGRVPSQLGYRFYVDSLMKRYSATVEDIENLNTELHRRYLNLNNVASCISDIISKITKCPTVVTMPTATGGRIVNVKMIMIEENLALIVVVLDGGSVRNKKVKVSGITYQEVDAISDFLNSQLAGLSAGDIDESRIMLIYGAMGKYKDFLKVVLEFVLECLKNNITEVYVGGASNILNHPEFCNIDRAREFLSFIDNRENATKVLSLSENSDSDGVKVLIGDETGLEEMHDTSIILTNYNAGGLFSGKIGVIGPTRMDYARIVSSLETINAQLSTILNEIFYEDE